MLKFDNPSGDDGIDPSLMGSWDHVSGFRARKSKQQTSLAA